MNDKTMKDNLLQKVPVEYIKKASKLAFKIKIENETGTGFLLNIKIDKKSIKCLFTVHHVITKDAVIKKKDIEIENEENMRASIQLDSEQRYIKCYDKPYDVTIVEILDGDNLGEDVFLDLDLNYLEGYEKYINKEIFIMQYPKGENEYFSIGKILSLGKNQFICEHNLDTDAGASGSPIILNDNNKVVAIHRGKMINSNKKIGTFIGTIIDDLKIIDKYNNIDEIISDLKNLLKDYYKMNAICCQDYKFNSLIKILQDSKNLFFLILGDNNLANIKVLNGLVESKILPDASRNKNIIIRHINNIKNYILRKQYFNKEQLDLNSVKILEGFEEIKNKFYENELEIMEKYSNYFYQIDTDIKFLKNVNNNDLKEKINFIHIPHLNENVYNHIIENCKRFLYIINDPKIKNNDFQKLKIMHDKLPEDNRISFSEFIKKFIFIYNYKNEENISDEAIETIKNDIKENLPLNEDEKKDLNIQLCFLNVEFYEKYMIKYYESLEKIIDSENNQDYSSLIETLSSIIPYPSESTSIVNIDSDEKEKLKKKYEFTDEQLDSINKYYCMIKDFFSKEEPKFKPKIEMFNKDLKIIMQDAEMERNKEFKQKINKKIEEIDSFFKKMPGNIFEIDEERKNTEFNLISTIIDKKKILLDFISTKYDDNSSRINEIKTNIEQIQFYKKIIDENTTQKDIESDFENTIDEIIKETKNVDYNLSQYEDFCNAIDALNDFNGKPKVNRQIQTFSNFLKKEEIVKKTEFLKSNINYYSNNANKFEKYPSTWWNYVMCCIFSSEKMIKIRDFLKDKCKEKIIGIDIKLENYNKDYSDYFKKTINETLEKELNKNDIDINISNVNDESINEQIEKKKKFNKKKISEWNKIKKKYENIKNKIISI